MPEQVFFPLTPKLKDGADRKIASFNRAGVWDSRASVELDNLSESLNIEDIVPKSIELTGIPDMWARPLLFEMALYDTRHPLHRRILGEWRGLSAMIALNKWRHLPLKVEKIKIPSQGGATAPASPDFLNALEKLTPSKTLSGDTDWHNLYVILFDGNPIGITSPTTIVCTSANYYNRIKNVAWFNGEFLLDPTNLLSLDEKAALASWLEQLKDNLHKHSQRIKGMSEYDKLLGLIDRQGDDEGKNKGFIQDLGGSPKTPIDLEQKGFGMTGGIFIYIDKPIAAIDVPPEKSHVLLRASKTLTGSPISLLVVDAKIAEQWRIKQHEILVNGTLTLASIQFSGIGSDRARIGSIPLPQLPQKLEWRLPKDFFTKKLFVIQQQNAFPGAMKIKGDDMLQFQGQTVTPILPINEELLNYFTADDLCQRVSFEQGTEGFVVYLRLPLSGPDGNGRDFVVQKEFRFRDNEVVSISTVPVLEVWPNFKINKIGKLSEPAWYIYYTYFSTTGEQTFYARPYTLGKKPDVQTFKDKLDKKVECEITRMDMFPEAMVCKGEVVNSQTSSIESIQAGILLLTPPELITQQQNKRWLIGIDFGTTGTNVYVTDTNCDPFPITFKERFLKVTASGDRRNYLYDDFLPGKEENAPFLSIFHDFQTKQVELRPLLDGHIYFLLDYTKFNATAQGMVTDLKWSEDPAVRFRTETFLEQLCLQCSAEAAVDGAEEISWRFSYPSAFSTGDIEAFQQIWNAITTKTGIKQSQGSPENKMESIVSAHFFAYHPDMQGIKKGLFGPGMVCIDIGGGTSDISIYQGNKLHWQTSLLFAGRNIFLDLLYAKPDFLEIFGVDVSSLNKTTGNRTAFYAQVDALISNQGQGWLNNLHAYAGNQEVKKFSQLIAVGLSSIFYYIGLLLQHLVKSTSYQGQMPNIYVAGNGAKMFHWLATGAYSSNSPISALFKSVLLKASGFKDDPKTFDVHISPEPKAEAAFGLVCTETDLDESGRTDKVMAGEVFIEDSKQCDWRETLTAGRIKKGLEVPQTLQNMEDFIEIFNSYANSKNAVIPSLFSNDILIKKRLSQKLLDLKGKEAKAIHVEPLFISALKILLKIKADEWASK